MSIKPLQMTKLLQLCKIYPVCKMIRLVFFVLLIYGFVYKMFQGRIFFLYLLKPMQVIMERANVVEINHKYISWGKVYVVRYGRKSPYYLNVEGGTIHTWNNNMTLHLIFYEYLHNEYRRSFVEMHLKLCDAVNSDPYVGKMLAKAGVYCPLPPGNHTVYHMTIEAAEFPNLWPFRKAKVEVTLAVTEPFVSMAKIDILVLFLQKKKKS